MTEDTGWPAEPVAEAAPEPEVKHPELRRLLEDAAHEAPVTAKVLAAILDLLP